MDVIADFVRGVLPEDNLVAGLNLLYLAIDVCIDNYMIHWRVDENHDKFKFCGKPYYQDTSGRVPVLYKSIWYLPFDG